MKLIIRISTYLLAILFALPLFGIIYMAFKDTEVEGFSVTIDNFIEAWNAAPFASYYLNTFIIVFGILIVQLFTITLAAYAFARMNFIGKGTVFFTLSYSNYDTN